jgi:hypothetical protein
MKKTCIPYSTDKTIASYRDFVKDKILKKRIIGNF